MRDAGNSWGEIAKVGRSRPLQVNHRLTFPRPSLIEPKEASRSIGIRYEAREQSFDGRLIALQDMHYADFAEDDVSFANTIHTIETKIDLVTLRAQPC